MADRDSFYAEIWPYLQQAGVHMPRPNPTFSNPPYEDATYRVLIVRLSPFRDVDRSTPHLSLFEAVRRALPGAYVDMAFLPPKHDRERLLAAGVRLLVGSQSFRAVPDFDLVLISNAYLLELINLPYLMMHSGIPLMASERDEEWPPIILGGSNATATQAIVTPSGDSMVDALFFGEGEEQVGLLVRGLRDERPAAKRSRLTKVAAVVRGLWVAGRGLGEPVEQAVVASPSTDHALIDYPLLNGAEANTGRLQISYGCPAFCSFCYEGYDRKPYRELSRSDILTAARRLKQAQGCEALELFSFNFNTHSDILQLLWDLNRIFDRVGFMSQRVDLLDCQPDLLDAEVAAGKRHFTLGIEGISDRQRAWLHKSLSADAIRRVIERLIRHRVRQLKLFYVLTGHEDAADLATFREFLGWLKAVRTRRNKPIRVTFSFGWLVRMPFTPLRHDRLLLEPDDWRDIVGPVKSACETNGFEFRMATEWDEYCTSQVLALGGHWLHELVVELAREGHHYDVRLSSGYWDAFRSRLVRRGYWEPALLGEKAPDHRFPMGFLRQAVSPSFLYRQFAQAKAGIDDGYCLGSSAGPGRCLACGACQDANRRQAITAHTTRPARDAAFPERLGAMMREKSRLKPVYVRVRTPATVAGTAPEWLNAWVLRALLNSYPELVDSLLSARESLFTVGPGRERYPIFYGETVFALKAWDARALVETVLRDAGPPGQVPPDGSGASASVQDRGPSSEAAGSGDDSTAVLGLAELFEPGTFTQAHLALKLPVEHFAGAGERLVHFLRQSYVPCNVRRVGEMVSLVLPKKSVKKRSVLAGGYEETAQWTYLRLTIGPKFDLGGYLRSFGEPGGYRRAQVAFSNLVW